MSNSTVGFAVIAGVVVLAAFSCGNDDDAVSPTAATSAASMQTAPVPPGVTAASWPAVNEMLRGGPPGVVATVTRVIDGDTFEVEGGAHVGLIGIHSCEAGTVGGAKAIKAAESQLTPGSLVKLMPEPGVETDPSGRLLRKVGARHGGDIGKNLVMGDHTGADQGQSYASPAYLAELRAADYDGRNCDGTQPAPAQTTAPAAEEQYVPVPNGGDDDHHHESRFCRKHRWC